jgi:hypothetical protein
MSSHETVMPGRTCRMDETAIRVVDEIGQKENAA